MTMQQQIADAILIECRAQLDSDDNKGSIGWVAGDLGTDSVTLDGAFDLNKIAQALIDMDKPKEWRCYHCDEVFTDAACARQHFGITEEQVPACQIRGSEGGLVKALRQAEEALFEATARLHAESADGLAAYRAHLTRHENAVRTAEEVGYNRGVNDAREEN
jgi:hypothetical protein